MDRDWLGRSVSELLSPGKYRTGGRPPSTSQSQTLRAVTYPAMLHMASGTLLGQNISGIVLHFRFGVHLWEDTLKYLLSLTWPCSGGSRQYSLRACPSSSTALYPSSKKAVSADSLPPKQKTCYFLEQLVAAITVR